MASTPIINNTIYVTCIPWFNKASATRCLEKDNAPWEGRVVAVTQEFWDLLVEVQSTDDIISVIINTWSEKDKKHLYQILHNNGMRI